MKDSPKNFAEFGKQFLIEESYIYYSIMLCWQNVLERPVCDNKERRRTVTMHRFS